MLDGLTLGDFLRIVGLALFLLFLGAALTLGMIVAAVSVQP
jgi:hypothetical protein